MRCFKPGIIRVYSDLGRRKPWSPPGVSLICARKMWPSTRGEGTVVAILDTGVDYTHPDLEKNIVGGVSLVPGVKDFMDENGHGTHVAGTIAANGGILGVAPQAKILAVKVLDSSGSGSSMNISRGLAWARQWRGGNGERVQVINMSMGGPIPDMTMHDEIKRAVKAGITVVCAAGNSGDGNPDTSEISYPAYYRESIAVGAVDLQTGIANFSSSNSRIDIVAPGVETYSTFPGGKYVKLSGTSMAAPHITGAVALIYSRWKKRFSTYPHPGFVTEMLHYQAVDLGLVGFDDLYGYGLFSFNIDGGKAIKLIIGQSKYYINGKPSALKHAPFLAGAEPCAAIQEICELMGNDSEYIPADDSIESHKGKICLWG